MSIELIRTFPCKSCGKKVVTNSRVKRRCDECQVVHDRVLRKSRVKRRKLK